MNFQGIKIRQRRSNIILLDSSNNILLAQITVEIRKMSNSDNIQNPAAEGKDQQGKEASPADSVDNIMNSSVGQRVAIVDDSACIVHVNFRGRQNPHVIYTGSSDPDLSTFGFHHVWITPPEGSGDIAADDIDDGTYLQAYDDAIENGYHLKYHKPQSQPQPQPRSVAEEGGDDGSELGSQDDGSQFVVLDTNVIGDGPVPDDLLLSLTKNKNILEGAADLIEKTPNPPGTRWIVIEYIVNTYFAVANCEYARIQNVFDKEKTDLVIYLKRTGKLVKNEQGECHQVHDDDLNGGNRYERYSKENPEFTLVHTLVQKIMPLSMFDMSRDFRTTGCVRAIRIIVAGKRRAPADGFYLKGVLDTLVKSGILGTGILKYRDHEVTDNYVLQKHRDFIEKISDYIKDFYPGDENALARNYLLNFINGVDGPQLVLDGIKKAARCYRPPWKIEQISKNYTQIEEVKAFRSSHPGVDPIEIPDDRYLPTCGFVRPPARRGGFGDRGKGSSSRPSARPENEFDEILGGGKGRGKGRGKGEGKGGKGKGDGFRGGRGKGRGKGEGRGGKGEGRGGKGGKGGKGRHEWSGPQSFEDLDGDAHKGTGDAKGLYGTRAHVKREFEERVKGREKKQIGDGGDGGDGGNGQ